MSFLEDLRAAHRARRMKFFHPEKIVPDKGINLKKERAPLPQGPIELPTKGLNTAQPITKHGAKVTIAEISPRKKFHPNSILPVHGWVPIKTIWFHVCQHYKVTLADIFSKRRISSLTLPRHVAFLLCCEHSRFSCAEVARRMLVDHTTVLHGKNRISLLMQTDEKIKNDVAKIRAAIINDWGGGGDRAAVPDLCERDLDPGRGEDGPKSEISSLDQTGGAVLSNTKTKVGPTQDISG